MSASLYNMDILRLATTIPHQGVLAHPQAVAEKRSPVCGSTIKVMLSLDDQGQVAEFAQEVRACALGQASAALLGVHVLGRDRMELAAAMVALKAFLTDEGAPVPAWPGLDIFAAARPHCARHASILLPFEATLAAAEDVERKDNNVV